MSSKLRESFGRNGQQKRRGFVSLPVVGTLIIFISFLFIVSFIQTEKAQVNIILSDAYHYRLASLLEIYRSDVSDLFTVGLGRDMQNFYLGPGWYGFSLDMEHPEDSLRARCNDFSSSVIDASCTLANRTGIPRVFKIMNTTYWFEGMEFSPQNPEAFKVFTHASGYQGTDTAFYGNCTALIGKNTLFDCGSYASSVVSGTWNWACKNETSTIPGCENGSFYILVNPTNNTVYPHLPRIRATDGYNEIRTAALGNEPYFLPVNYPAFYYLAAAYELGKFLANGTDGVADCSSGLKSVGIMQGFSCGDASTCAFTSCPCAEQVGCGSSTTPDGAKAEISEKFADLVVAACGMVEREFPGLQVYFSNNSFEPQTPKYYFNHSYPSPGPEGSSPPYSDNWYFHCNESDHNKLSWKALNKTIYNSLAASNSHRLSSITYYEYIRTFEHYFIIVDSDKSRWADPSMPNYLLQKYRIPAPTLHGRLH